MPSKVKRPVSINGIEFDALITEDRTLEASVPEYSVEDGYSVSDSIIIGSEKLSMTLFVTNTPVTWYRRHGSSNTRVKNVCARLEQMFFEATPVTIITNEKVYRNMAIESIGARSQFASVSARTWKQVIREKYRFLSRKFV